MNLIWFEILSLVQFPHLRCYKEGPTAVALSGSGRPRLVAKIENLFSSGHESQLPESAFCLIAGIALADMVLWVVLAI
jgi:hypothetical protein